MQRSKEYNKDSRNTYTQSKPGDFDKSNKNIGVSINAASENWLSMHRINQDISHPMQKLTQN